MILLERASTQTYEGHPSELNIAMLPKNTRVNRDLRLHRGLFDVKRNRALLVGHRNVLHCDRKGTVIDVKVHPYWKFTERTGMYLGPHEYQPSLHHAYTQKALSFMLTRHGEIFAAVGGDITSVYRDGCWKLSGVARFRDILDREIVKLDDSLDDAGPLSGFGLMLALSVRHRKKGGMLLIAAEESDVRSLRRSRKTSTAVEWSPDDLIRDHIAFNIPVTLLINAMTVDGATVLTLDGRVRDYGLVINTQKHKSDSEGARTRASEFASKKGVVIKVSEDGPVSLFAGGRLLCEILK